MWGTGINDVPGGSTHCHEIDGFEFNSGGDSIGDMDPRVGRGLFRATADFITGGKLEWAKMPDVHETCTFGDDVYEWFSSPEKNIEWIERRFPGEGNRHARRKAAAERRHEGGFTAARPYELHAVAIPNDGRPLALKVGV